VIINDEFRPLGYYDRDEECEDNDGPYHHFENYNSDINGKNYGTVGVVGG
jgi:hypothetical protein